MKKGIQKQLLTALLLSITACMIGGEPIQCITRTFDYGVDPNFNTPSAVELSQSGNGFVIESNGKYYVADHSGIRPAADDAEANNVKSAPLENVPVDTIQKHFPMRLTGAMKSSTHIFGKASNGELYSARIGGANEQNSESAIEKIGDFKDAQIKKIVPSSSGETVCVLLDDGSLWNYDSSRTTSPLVEYKDIDNVADVTYLADINQFVAATDDKVYTTDSNGDWAGICESTTGKISALANNGRTVAITTQKALLVATPSAVSVSATAQLVGPAAGKPNDAVYRITITGKDLSAADVYGNGYNGIRYVVSDSQDASYTKDAYPLCGIKYIDDAQTQLLFHQIRFHSYG